MEEMMQLILLKDMVQWFLRLKKKASEELTEQEGTWLKILTAKQMLRILPIAFEQVKAGNNSENLLNEIRQIAYSLYQSRDFTR